MANAINGFGVRVAHLLSVLPVCPFVQRRRPSWSASSKLRSKLDPRREQAESRKSKARH